MIMRIFQKTNFIFSKAAVVAILVYQKIIGIFIPPSCIYHPSCSEYACESFHQHGFFPGMYLTISRILRCHPFEQGGIDEVPETFSIFKKRIKTKSTNINGKYG